MKQEYHCDKFNNFKKETMNPIIILNFNNNKNNNASLQEE